MPTRPDSPQLYGAYLLRFWLEEDQKGSEATTWRFSLENPHTREILGFPNLEKLVAFIKKEIESLTHEVVEE